MSQNTPTIATIETQYGEIRYQDIAAMESYAGSLIVALELTPLTCATADLRHGGANESNDDNGGAASETEHTRCSCGKRIQPTGGPAIRGRGEPGHHPDNYARRRPSA
nr:hypothetical protein [Mycobacterium uberis]